MEKLSSDKHMEYRLDVHDKRRGTSGKSERKEGVIMWQEPKINWIANDTLTALDFDRIEGNIQYLKELLG